MVKTFSDKTLKKKQLFSIFNIGKKGKKTKEGAEETKNSRKKGAYKPFYLDSVIFKIINVYLS